MQLSDVLVLIKEDIKNNIPVFICGQPGSGKTRLTNLATQFCMDDTICSILVLDEVSSVADKELVNAAMTARIPIIAVAQCNNPQHIINWLDKDGSNKAEFRFIYLDRTFRENRGNVNKCERIFVRAILNVKESED